jgi:large subunit ribosomal protein L4e
MQLKIINASKTEMGKMELPMQFREDVRPDIIKRAFLSAKGNARQPYGSDPKSGFHTSTRISRRRRDYKGSYGKGISRVPRKTMSRSGSQFNWVGAFSPGTVGGRIAHGPKVEKDWTLKLNKKERKKAIRSALASTMYKELVKVRGHRVPDIYPFIVGEDIEKVARTKDIKLMLEKLGFGDELSRISERKYRAGKGKSRGRRYRSKTGLLIVVSRPCALMHAAANINIDVVEVNSLGVPALAPGAVPGRMTLFTDSALKRMEKEKLFM